MRSFVLLVLAGISSAVAQPSTVNVRFSPESESEKLVAATREYQDIWKSDGQRMIEAMEAVSGLKFAETEIPAIVYEGTSFSGSRNAPMKLRASYPIDTKKATLIHELGHRLLSDVPKTAELDDHRLLFLVLYDIWVKLYGKAFADEQVAVEKLRKGRYDYESAWQWALSLSEKDRAAKFQEQVRKMSNGKKLP